MLNICVSFNINFISLKQIENFHEEHCYYSLHGFLVVSAKFHEQMIIKITIYKSFLNCSVKLLQVKNIYFNWQLNQLTFIIMLGNALVIEY